MLELYEHKLNPYWGSDPGTIVYPGVSSCVTLTYYYKATPHGGGPLLVGAHFGLYNGDGSNVTCSFIYRVLSLMDHRGPRPMPTRAFILGQNNVWSRSAPAQWHALLAGVQTKMGHHDVHHAGPFFNLNALPLEIKDLQDDVAGVYQAGADISIHVWGEIKIEHLDRWDRLDFPIQ